MKNAIIGGLLTAALAFVLPISAAPPIKVMLLDGEQAGAYHAWQETTPDKIEEAAHMDPIDV